MAARDDGTQLSALRLYAVAALDGGGEHPLVPGTSLVAYRDIGAVVTEAEYQGIELNNEALAEHRRIVDAIAALRPVLPAPAGVIFRSHDTLLKWLEVHYATLNDGLRFVEGRMVARVHIYRRDLNVSDESAHELLAVSAETFRELRRDAVAAVPLRPDEDTRVLFSASFLVDRDRWQTFLHEVRDEERRHPELVLETTGPWAPYDFVRMQFGS